MKRTPLKRKTAITRGKPLAKRSKKQAQIYVERRKLVSTQLALRPWCEAHLRGCERRSADLHEPLTRARGGSILDKTNTVAVCRHCHDEIHTGNQQHMHDLGLLRHAWEAPQPRTPLDLGARMYSADLVFTPSQASRHTNVPRAVTTSEKAARNASRRKAALYVCACNPDPDIAAELLDMLGLRPLEVA